MNEDEPTAASEVDERLAEVSVGAELVAAQAERGIQQAVSGRHRIARTYVRRLRRRNPEATPAEIISMLERHYLAAVSVAGAAVAVGSVALEVGMSLFPGGGAAAAGGRAVATGAGQAAAKKAAKQAIKAAGKQAAAGVAKSGAERAAALLPAGDAQLQFEITGLFALAIADIHGMKLDQHQAHALVYGLSNGRVSQHQIASMATDLAESSRPGLASVGQTIAGGRDDWSHWANTLADALPGGEAQRLVRGVQTGALEDVRAGLGGKRQAAVEYGVGAMVGGATRFVFGREVVGAARSAFAEPPKSFPQHLDVPSTLEKLDGESNRALQALEDAAKSMGAGIGTGASAVGSSMAIAAGAVTRPFRSVDLDGDGVPDQPQAVTLVKGVGTAAGVATRPFRRVDRDGDGVPDQPQLLSGAKEIGVTLASSLRTRRPAARTDVDAHQE